VGEIRNEAATLADKVQLPYVTLTGSPTLTENVRVSITQAT